MNAYDTVWSSRPSDNERTTMAEVWTPYECFLVIILSDPQNLMSSTAYISIYTREQQIEIKIQQPTTAAATS